MCVCVLVVGERAPLRGVQRREGRLPERRAVLLRAAVHDELPQQQVDLGPFQVQDTQEAQRMRGNRIEDGHAPMMERMEMQIMC